MTRAKLDRRIRAEEAREGLLSCWLMHVLEKSKRSRRRVANIRACEYEQ